MNAMFSAPIDLYNTLELRAFHTLMKARKNLLTLKISDRMDFNM